MSDSPSIHCHALSVLRIGNEPLLSPCSGGSYPRRTQKTSRCLWNFPGWLSLQAPLVFRICHMEVSMDSSVCTQEGRLFQRHVSHVSVCALEDTGSLLFSIVIADMFSISFASPPSLLKDPGFIYFAQIICEALGPAYLLPPPLPLLPRAPGTGIRSPGSKRDTHSLLPDLSQGASFSHRQGRKSGEREVIELAHNLLTLTCKLKHPVVQIRAEWRANETLPLLSWPPVGLQHLQVTVGTFPGLCTWFRTCWHPGSESRERRP